MIMSSNKVTKSHSEIVSNNNDRATKQLKLNGTTKQTNLIKQEKVDVTEKENKATLKGAHSISICINTFEENGGNMRQTVDQVTEINNLGNGVDKIKLDDDLKQSNDLTILPNIDNCDLKDKKRTKHLVRCEAVRESSLSPPPPCSSETTNQVNSNSLSCNTNHLTVYSNNKNVTVIKNSSLKSGSSQSNSGASSPSLSRDSSTDNNFDYSSAELQSFLTDAMKKNPKDRMFILRVEHEMIQFMKDETKESFKFASTSSYNRMLIHRVAAYFGLEHNVDQAHSSVIVTKTKGTLMPEAKLKDLIKDDESTNDEPKKSILKRDSNSLEDSIGGSFDKDKSPDYYLNGSLSDSSRSRSLEEREENYERVRARIFSNNSSKSNSNVGDSTSSSSGQKSPINGDVKVNDSESKMDNSLDSTVATTAIEEGVNVHNSESSPINESHNECDKTQDALSPNAPAINVKANNGCDNNQTKNNSTSATEITTTNQINGSVKSNVTSNETRRNNGPNNNGRFDGMNHNRGKFGGNYNHRNRVPFGAECNNQFNNRFNQPQYNNGGNHNNHHHHHHPLHLQQPILHNNRKSDLMSNVKMMNESEWSLKPNLNVKLASQTQQNMPYSFQYPQMVDPNCIPRFQPALNHHGPTNGSQYQLGHPNLHPYMQPAPLLPNDQLLPHMNYPNSSMIPLITNHQANVPNSLFNPLNYNNNINGFVNTPHSSSASNLSIANNMYMYGGGNGGPLQTLCGPNGLSYVNNMSSGTQPTGPLQPQTAPQPPQPSASYNSLLGVPQYPPTGAAPVASLLPNIPQNHYSKQSLLNDYDKGQTLKNHYQQQQHLHHHGGQKNPLPLQINYGANQFAYSAEVPPVPFNSNSHFQTNETHLLGSRPPHGNVSFPVAGHHYTNNVAKHYPNEHFFMNNPNFNLSQPTNHAMFLNHPNDSYYGNHQSKSNGGVGGGTNRYSNNQNNRNRRGPNQSSNRKF